jgi:hypothetical protein
MYVGIATRLRAGRPKESGFDSQLEQENLHTGSGAHRVSYKMGKGDFPRGKAARA